MTLRYVACALLLGCASLACGEIIGSPVSIQATGPSGTGSWSANLEDGEFDGDGNYSYSLTEPIIIRSDNGDEIATVETAVLSVIADPVVSLNFVVSSPDATTIFNIASPLVTFPSIDAEGRASAAITLTDIGGNGGSLTGLLPGGKAYEADYDSTNAFATLVTGATTPNFSSVTSSEELPLGGAFSPIGLISSQSSLFSFELGSLDAASGTSVWVTRVVPEPSSLALLIAPLFVFGMRIRRRA